MIKKVLGYFILQNINLKNFSFVLNISIVLLLCFTAHSQNTTIRGRVTDSVGKPLQDVSVTIKGTKKGTSTNAGGEFQLNAVPERSTLVISFVGLTTREVKLAAGQQLVSVVMREDVSSLQNVVVTGFQRIDKKKFTGAAVTLKAEDVRTEG